MGQRPEQPGKWSRFAVVVTIERSESLTMPLLLLLSGAAGPILAGAFVVRRRPRNPVGWLLVLQGVGFGAVLAAAGPHDRGSGLVADQLLSGAWVLLFAGVATAAYLVPDGRPASSFCPTCRVSSAW